MIPVRAAPIAAWLPAGKRAAVCFSVDDIHPGTSRDPYEAGGDLERGVLGRLSDLLRRHPGLRATLFVTPDWRLISARPSGRRLARLPLVRRFVYHAKIHPRGRMRLDRHPAFARFLAALPRTEVAIHGLHHVRRGPDMTAELRDMGRWRCARRLRRALWIFRRAGLEPAPGLQPPRWHLSPALAAAAAAVGLRFVSSARDLETVPAPGARTAGSGRRGMSLLYPERLGPLVHVSTNFQATSRDERALRILDAGGLLAIKAHAVEDVGGHRMIDALDHRYRDRLDALFGELERRWGDALWWTSLAEIAARVASPAAR